MVEGDVAESLPREADLVEVPRTPRAYGDMLLETGARVGVEAVIEVVGDELDELATAKTAEVHVLPAGHGAPTRYAARASRIRARPRCNKTRWLTAVRSSIAHTSSAP